MDRTIDFKSWDSKKKIWTNFMIVDNMLRFMDKFAGVWIGDDKQERFKLVQYTGLKDKNGKEIYEGDIVIVGKENWTCKVYYSDIMQAFMLKDLDFEYRKSLNFMSQFSTYKVIGNTFANPELIKENNDK